jgi:hypothetical protein
MKVVIGRGLHLWRTTAFVTMSALHDRLLFHLIRASGVTNLTLWTLCNSSRTVAIIASIVPQQPRQTAPAAAWAAAC